MGRPANVIPPTKLTTSIPQDVRVKLDLHLFSEIENRIPTGAYQRFIIERVQEFFSHRRLDVSEAFGAPKGSMIISGPADAILHIYNLISAHRPQT